MASMFELQPFLSSLGLSNPGQPVTGANVAPGGGFQFQDPTKGMGFFDRMKYYQQNNPEVLLNFAAGMLKGDSGLAVHDASAAIGATRKEERDKQALAVQQNSTLDYLVSKGVSREEALAAVNDPMILKALLQEAEEKRNPDFAATVYGTPIGLIGPDKEYAIGALGKNGVVLKDGQPLPPGWRAATPYEQALGKGIGGGEAEIVTKAKETLGILRSTMPNLIRVTTRLKDLTKTATSTTAGRARDALLRETGQEMSQAGIDREEYERAVQGVILPMLRPTFGSQFTLVEGQKLETILGDPNKSPEEKNVAIDTYVRQAQANLAAAAAQSGEYSNPYDPSETTIDPDLKEKYGLE